MNTKRHFESLTGELEALFDRVENFIGEVHQPTKGDWRESVLRSAIEQKLPATVKIGRGFILDEHRPSTECDVLIYRADHPIHFQNGNLVFLSPGAVLGVIEVKSSLNREDFTAAIEKLSDIGRLFVNLEKRPFLGLFSYKCGGNPQAWFRELLPVICDERHRVIDLISIGCDNFLKWWENDPMRHNEEPPYLHWHSYKLEDMAAGYFITNVIDAASEGKVSANDGLWFPPEGKEGTEGRQIIPSRFLIPRL